MAKQNKPDSTKIETGSQQNDRSKSKVGWNLNADKDALDPQNDKAFSDAQSKATGNRRDQVNSEKLDRDPIESRSNDSDSYASKKENSF